MRLKHTSIYDFCSSEEILVA